MSLIVLNPTGEPVQLAAEPLARGGEAEVYEVPRYPNAVVKLYYPDALTSRGNTLQEKIEAICRDNNLAVLKHDKALSWPLFAVYDEQQKWRGYAMRKAQGVRLSVLAHAMAYREHFPTLDRPMLVGYLLALLDTVHRLHTRGVRLGDYNPANFLCHTTETTVNLIDCDSWQVNAEGQTYYCPVAVPDMLAPELHGKNLADVPRSLESELFSLAILIFKLLMLGRHPFDVVGGESPVQNIRKGYFPYGLGAGGIPKGPWYNIWSHMPYRLKEQFVRTFNEGNRNPAARTTVQEWIDLLNLYHRDMKRGYHASVIRPITPKSSEYRGRDSVSQVENIL